MAKYRKKPVIIDAIQYTGVNVPQIEEFMADNLAALHRVTDEQSNAAAIPLPPIKRLLAIW